ncbi:Manganese-transporting ATPase 4 [Thelohanellus kitauei]|uniref:Manganese-transporting ATPase 4 n=1 Tax=Thelohanellus kitauei TaxID=669202 RepID=A0A0C2M5S8_THEKT|nr:Manganese-transporting ATPase 4 [Thelohanellus kitauei]
MSYGIISLLIYYSTFKIEPTKNIPNIKPVKSLFGPYITLTILFQSAIHIYTVLYLSTNMGVQFPIPDPMEQISPLLTKFKPSYFSSILLYYEFFTMLAIYVINYCVRF